MGMSGEPPVTDTQPLHTCVHTRTQRTHPCLAHTVRPPPDEQKGVGLQIKPELFLTVKRRQAGFGPAFTHISSGSLLALDIPATSLLILHKDTEALLTELQAKTHKE